MLTPQSKQLRTDADATFFLEKMLTAYDPKLYRVIYVEPEFQKHIPVNNSIPRGAAEYAYVIYDAVGMASWYSGRGEDLPLVTATKQRVTHPMKPFGIASGYGDDDLERAAFEAKIMESQGMTGPTSLDLEQENAAGMAIAQFHENISVTGDASVNILGVTSQPNIGIYSIPNGDAGSPLWPNKTPDEILADLNGAVRFVVGNVKGTGALTPDTMLLPLDSYQLISTLARSINSDTTVLDFFLKNNRYIKNVEPWPRLDTAGPSGSRFGLVYRKDPMVLEYRTGIQYERVTPQRKGMGWEVFHKANSGGVVVKYPVAVAQFTGF